MVDQFILGVFIASLLGFVMLHQIRRKKMNRASSMGIKENECLEGSRIEMLCGSERTTNTDIIIVGAGVAGSALAFTLGKVKVSSFSDC